MLGGKRERDRRRWYEVVQDTQGIEVHGYHEERLLGYRRVLGYHTIDLCPTLNILRTTPKYDIIMTRG